VEAVAAVALMTLREAAAERSWVLKSDRNPESPLLYGW